MSDEFIKMKTTESQVVYLRKDAVDAIEEVPASNRVEGHSKVYVAGFKFLIEAKAEEILKDIKD